jgi:hypothetical protein
VVTQTDGIQCSPDVPGVRLWYNVADYDKAWFKLSEQLGINN